MKQVSHVLFLYNTPGSVGLILRWILIDLKQWESIDTYHILLCVLRCSSLAATFTAKTPASTTAVCRWPWSHQKYNEHSHEGKWFSLSLVTGTWYVDLDAGFCPPCLMGRVCTGLAVLCIGACFEEDHWFAGAQGACDYFQYNGGEYYVTARMSHCQFVPLAADSPMLRIPGMPGHGLSVSQVNPGVLGMKLGLLTGLLFGWKEGLVDYGRNVALVNKD